MHQPNSGESKKTTLKCSVCRINIRICNNSTVLFVIEIRFLIHACFRIKSVIMSHHSMVRPVVKIGRNKCIAPKQCV